jgi:excisionase family DNA binding protein
MPTDSEILTLEELHTYLKIPKPTLYALAQTARIPAAKVGKHWRFRKTDIDEWLNAQKWARPIQRRTRNRNRTDGSQ